MMNSQVKTEVEFFREMIARNTVDGPYGKGLPAPWAFLEIACKFIENQNKNPFPIPYNQMSVHELEVVAETQENTLALAIIKILQERDSQDRYDADEAEKEISDLQDQVDDLEYDLRSANSEIEVLEQKVDDLSDELEQVRKEKEELEHRIESLEK